MTYIMPVMSFSIGSANGMVPSGNNLLPESISAISNIDT